MAMGQRHCDHCHCDRSIVCVCVCGCGRVGRGRGRGRRLFRVLFENFSECQKDVRIKE
jgi:hypothetical protein